MAQRRVRKSGRKIKTTAVILLVVAMLATLSGWAIVVVRGADRIPTSDFVTIPTEIISKQGVQTAFQNVTTIFRSGLAVGVMGYLLTSSGTPIANAQVYMTYYYEFAYRNQITTTDQNGFFEVIFPMNWTGWLPLTITYFGGSQYRGLKQVFSLAGEGL
jgi:hypothetical protein